MKSIFLNQKKNKNLILFFSGFACSFKMFEHLKYDEFDVLIIYNYTDNNADFLHFLKVYEGIYLLAFSMGVMIASKINFNINFIKKIAINGSLEGIGQKSIDKRIFKLSIKNFNLDEFLKAANYLEFKEFLNYDFKEELKNILALSKEKSYLKNYDKLILSDKEHIFKKLEKEDFYKQLQKISSYHYCFKDFKSWKEIIF
ncbi:DUF452 family protein [Campylobacter canadensis]|uniref:pimeloyl-ACP methyl esterase BioG family protein n=1 Tax=Campylobacter canadensis TaxID=449520 RepID=UPI001CCD77D1|nr:pimeloyl-ACP methyl esterase BioG family protein [Campylobacter canadensis]MBZ7996938.1 DUF452 family protein [Campylobacter canadensis]MBZ8000417.1 DUF452 family protein [Campylobacter canadensis]MBZ8002216.1 DUF452 family protein [Campylobacter canadensis]MBZ8003057.1 DUF452 family protein [Campylobacter canadensis]